MANTQNDGKNLTKEAVIYGGHMPPLISESKCEIPQTLFIKAARCLNKSQSHMEADSAQQQRYH